MEDVNFRKFKKREKEEVCISMGENDISVLIIEATVYVHVESELKRSLEQIF